MDTAIFSQLVQVLRTVGRLRDSNFISVEAMVLFFISALVGKSNGEIRDRWQHSGSTIIVPNLIIDAWVVIFGFVND